MTNPYGPSGQYPGGPAYQPAPQPQPKKEKKKWPWIVGGAVVFFVLVGSMGSPENSESAASASDTTSAGETTSPARSTLTAADLQAKQAREKEEAAKVEAAAQARRDAEAAAQAALLDPANYERLTDRDFALIARDPDAHVGRKIVVYGAVVQADTGTGNSAFRASTAASQYWKRYDFDQNSLVRVSNPSIIANVLEDDLVEMFIEVKGSYTYSTTMGGKTTVPELQANIVNVYSTG